MASMSSSLTGIPISPKNSAKVPILYDGFTSTTLPSVWFKNGSPGPPGLTSSSGIITSSSGSTSSTTSSSGIITSAGATWSKNGSSNPPAPGSGSTRIGSDSASGVSGCIKPSLAPGIWPPGCIYGANGTFIIGGIVAGGIKPSPAPGISPPACIYGGSGIFILCWFTGIVAGFTDVIATKPILTNGFWDPFIVASLMSVASTVKVVGLPVWSVAVIIKFAMITSPFG